MKNKMLFSQEFPLREEFSKGKEAFSLHTDNYKKVHNASIIGLLCVKPARIGGENYIVSLSSLLERLPSSIVSDMKNPIWPHPTGSIPLLTETATGYSIRYNRDDIREVSEVLKIKLDDKHFNVLDAIDDVSNLAKKTILLDSQDMVILNNTKFLHGRSCFEQNSDRELIRWRINEIY